MRDIMEIVKSLEDSGALSKDVSETLEFKEQKSVFFGLLLGTIDASLLGSMLAAKAGKLR